ncbi:MAG: SGNH/GDSL hydrolase family protein [Verrucomicrobiales bacterium]|nr:SGNH/GDSL hydrolase family protein [Verrucomicrobiales bacterium]
MRVMMKASLFFLLVAVGTLRGEQVLIFGDSLSKEYAVEFAVDGYPDRVKCWTEIVDELRGDELGYGNNTTFTHPNTLFFGHEYNWAFPGAKIGDWVDVVEGKTFVDQLARTEIRGQLRSEVERFVLFVGGNDVDSVYRDAYEGAGWSGFIRDFVADVETVLDWVEGEAAEGVEMVLVGAPHVGATPKVKGEYPTNAVKTGRVSRELARLNGELAAVAAERGIGFADIAPLTEELIYTEDYCYQGIRFRNDGDAGGDELDVWLGGVASDNFHPNTIGQAVVANVIIGAFNEAYGAGIEPLSTEEILGGLLGKNPDMGYGTWAACYGVGGRDEDGDGDGVSNLVEYGTGTDPRVADGAGSGLPFVRRVEDRGGSFFELVYGTRLESSGRVEVVAEVGDAVWRWGRVEGGDLVKLPDGRWRARLALFRERAGFLRLVVRELQ